jgi:glycosyltransferase involved in cell wall biosynthesis
MEQPLISVIVPVYNVEGYVQPCLDALLAQTWPKLELILIDDASTDGSGDVCEACAARDSRVRVVRFPENRGPSAARNEGVRRASGAYIAFVDADDRAEAVRCLARGIPFNMVPWGKLYRAELVRQCPFDEAVFYSEDLLFLYAVLKRARRVAYRPDVLYHYTQRTGSQVQSGMTRRKSTALSAHDQVCTDAAASFPEAVEDFRQLVLEADRNMAVLAVKNGCEGGRTFSYLKRIQANVRRHFSRRALALCPGRKEAARCLARRTHFLWTVWGKLFPAELVKGIPFDRQAFCCEDLLFFYQILRRAGRIAYVPDPLYHYVYREGSLVNNGVTSQRCTVLSVLDGICEDAAACFPEGEACFRQVALDTAARLAMQAVESGAEGGLEDCLQRFRADIRRHFRWRAWGLCPDPKSGAAELALLAGVPVFKILSAAYRLVKRLRQKRRG